MTDYGAAKTPLTSSPGAKFSWHSGQWLATLSDFAATNKEESVT